MRVSSVVAKSTDIDENGSRALGEEGEVTSARSSISTLVPGKEVVAAGDVEPRYSVYCVSDMGFEDPASDLVCKPRGYWDAC